MMDRPPCFLATSSCCLRGPKTHPNQDWRPAALLLVVVCVRAIEERLAVDIAVAHNGILHIGA